MQEIIKICRESQILTNSGSLPEAKIISLIKASEFKTYKRGMFLCVQGAEGDGMYIVLSGDILILRNDVSNPNSEQEDDDSDDEDEEGHVKVLSKKASHRVKKIDPDPSVPSGYRKVAEIHKGGSFGETSLLKNVPRNASACVKTREALVLFISRELFQKLKSFGVLDLSSQLHRSSMLSKLYDILQKTPCLAELSQGKIKSKIKFQNFYDVFFFSLHTDIYLTKYFFSFIQLSIYNNTNNLIL